MTIPKIVWHISTSFKAIIQIIRMNFIFYIIKFKSPFFYKPIKYFFLFFMWRTTSVIIKIIVSNLVRFNYLFSMLFYCTNLVLLTYSTIINISVSINNSNFTPVFFEAASHTNMQLYLIQTSFLCLLIRYL